jgi:hypothetical protein
MADVTPILVILSVLFFVMLVILLAGVALLVIGLLAKKPALWITGLVMVPASTAGTIGIGLAIMG